MGTGSEDVPSARWRNVRTVFDLMRGRRLHCRPLRTHLISPERAQEAYTGLRDRKDECLGVVFDWSLVEPHGLAGPRDVVQA